MTAVNLSSGAKLTLSSPLKISHNAQRPAYSGRTIEMRAEVGRLSGRIIIEGDANSTRPKYGGHVMVIARGKAMVDGVELRRLGQFNKLGCYPFHWHLVGDATGGQYIRNRAVHSSFQRGIVVHGTQNAQINGNVVYDTPGHSYFIEDPLSINNVLQNNLALENRLLILSQVTLKD